jgi:ABC-2 type transport system ATP-binding protein|tara:strand:+ start:33388 stop:34266 length:879 start_codon:yes stop_codon:yes gene_type:complete
MKKEIILSTSKLSKSFGDLLALDKVSIDVPKNSIFGILGPNGSGKSTLMRILSGLIRSWNGSIYFENNSINKSSNSYLKNFGFMIENPSFYEYLTAQENLEIFNRLVNTEVSRVAQVLARVDLLEWSDTKVDQFSYGMKQRLGIAQALLHDPKILILDEPNNGLDPSGITEMNKLMADLKNDGKTVCISTHILKDVESLCTDVAVLKKGKLILSSSLKTLLKKSNSFFIGSSNVDGLAKVLNKNTNIRINELTNKTIQLETKLSFQELSSLIPGNLNISLIEKESGLKKLFI